MLLCIDSGYNMVYWLVVSGNINDTDAHSLTANWCESESLNIQKHNFVLHTSFLWCKFSVSLLQIFRHVR